ncbi:hypothetical protein ACJX0J_008688, partial [Zea mays]
VNFHEHDDKGSTGWVMHEYSITASLEYVESSPVPAHLSTPLPLRVYCIRHSGHEKNGKKQSRDEEDWGTEDKVDDAAVATTYCAAEEDP